MLPARAKAIRAALHALEDAGGDVKALEGDLSGYWRLRVSKYRVIFSYTTRRGQRIAECVYAAERSIVYEIFSEQLRRELARKRLKRAEGASPDL